MLRFAKAEDIVITNSEIMQATGELADYYNNLYVGTKEVTVITVLEGARNFAEVLKPLLRPKVTNDTMKVTSMNGTVSTGRLTFDKQPQTDLAGKDILVVEDLIDTGITLSGIAKYLLQERMARSVNFAALCEKPESRKPETHVPNLKTGIAISNKYIVGFGMDWNQKYRELPYITYAEETETGSDIWIPVYSEAA